MEENGNIYILVNDIIAGESDLEALRAVYPGLIIRRISMGICTVQVPPGTEATFDAFQQNVRYINPPVLYGLNAVEALEVSNILTFHNYPYGALRGSGILVGFVDTGIEYTNTYFRNADGTSRIAAIWDQTIPGNPPDDFGYGSVYEQSQINEALSSSNPYDIVPSRDTNGHGTFLAGVAAGNDQSDAATFTGAAPNAEIIMVKLRPASPEIMSLYMVLENAVAYQSNDVLTGIQFLINKAGQLNRPIVICIGLGDNFGAHNGTAILEQYIQNVGLTNGVIVVCGAGNEANAGNHYSGELTPSIPLNVEINVSQNERGFLVSVWANISQRLYVSFRSPLGQTIERVPIINRGNQRYKFNLEPTILDINYLYTDPFNGMEAVIIRFINPTPGIWNVIVASEASLNGKFHIWLPRQGFIDEDTYFLSSDPDYTVQVPGTAEYIITVGAYDANDNSVYVASGRGPTTSLVIKPDIIAPGVNVEGPRVGGGLTTYTGTSVSAAITAGASALLLEWAILKGNVLEMNTRIARGVLIRGARRLNTIAYPNNIEGYGRLDLFNSIANN